LHLTDRLSDIPGCLKVCVLEAEWQLSTAHNPVLVLRSRRPIAAFEGELAVNLVAAGDASSTYAMIFHDFN